MLIGRSANPGTSESRIWGTSSQICVCTVKYEVLKGLMWTNIMEFEVSVPETGIFPTK